MTSHINRMLIITISPASAVRDAAAAGGTSGTAIKEPPECEFEEPVHRLIAVVHPLHFAVVRLARPQTIRIDWIEVRCIGRVFDFGNIQSLLLPQSSVEI